MADEKREWVELTEVWGEEKFTPVSYCTFTVGPFSATARVSLPAKPSAIEEARRRLRAELVASAEAERARKRDSFLAELDRAGRR